MAQMKLYTKQEQIHRHRDQICDCKVRKGWYVRDRLGVWGWKTQTIVFRMRKQQGLTV